VCYTVIVVKNSKFNMSFHSIMPKMLLLWTLHLYFSSKEWLTSNEQETGKFFLISCNSVSCSSTYYLAQSIVYNTSHFFLHSSFWGMHTSWDQCIKVTIPLVDIGYKVYNRSSRIILHHHYIRICANYYKCLEIDWIHGKN